MLKFDARQNHILHLSWLAFFFSFVAWFNMAPFNTTLIRTVGLSQEQINILMLCNVSLTIPARILIGILVDHFGARKVFSYLLIFSAGVCFYFASGESFEDFLIARLLMGIVGAGFVVGIKMISEWFPPEKTGLAQGVYAGLRMSPTNYRMYEIDFNARPAQRLAEIEKKQEVNDDAAE
jgi:NNP family nitrate/nitrite transporter-like MFS transporter